jgi:hypothetical protein
MRSQRSEIRARNKPDSKKPLRHAGTVVGKVEALKSELVVRPQDAREANRQRTDGILVEVCCRGGAGDERSNLCQPGWASDPAPRRRHAPDR